MKIHHAMYVNTYEPDLCSTVWNGDEFLWWGQPPFPAPPPPPHWNLQWELHCLSRGRVPPFKMDHPPPWCPEMQPCCLLFSGCCIANYFQGTYSHGLVISCWVWILPVSC
jgi:hypothetical protein